ncbi:endonuclease/exonuclease/phosphatase family protein [Actinoplanes bogorensis]|uniref:Endonuclease/exonuclease/phosphatase family protein n=1 Tax=Paractinoplanes bogorensis TaxID=1610840 RepID=A0ABS5YUD6_9ACTN|nr:endonuclease/exonuclease/phosphatase family protein [Actinoplanes bogorensis]MBU2666289.1 endonuclease/exonuclease/phosphatase family protein [Actinoplanes bogorensis]
MTWNIKTGGRGRLEAIIAVINRERPDLLALQELRGWESGDARILRQIADAVDMVPHLARSFLGQPVAVFVRAPLEVTDRSAVRFRLHHAAAVVTVSTPMGPLRVVSTHLNPFSPPRRRREAVWLAHRYQPGAVPTVIAGDLNGLDPGTDHTETLAPQPGFLRARHLAADGTADTRAVGAFLDAGYTDLWKVAGSGSPLTVPTTRGGGREFSRMRLDYVLAGPSIAAGAKDMVVVRGEETEFASDHYPVRVELPPMIDLMKRF